MSCNHMYALSNEKSERYHITGKRKYASIYRFFTQRIFIVCRYAKMDASEIRLDRYAKFRKLGMFEEFLVHGGQWREARAARAKVRRNQ